ncbi:MAG: hypothetical protein JNK04_22905, partial [Myxococcales bacterium]|nr:hypothetical protein [Myxococcales bacterium]
RLVVERQLTEFPGRYHETFYRWESDGTARVNYGDHPKKPLINAAWLSRDGAGRVGSIATVYARGNTLAETFTYDDQGRVIGAERRGTNPPHGDLHDFRDLEYDAAGRIVRVFWRYPDGRRVLDFERPSDSQTFAALRTVLSDGLVRAIAAALGRLAIEHPVFALGIGFCGAEYQHRLPPNVAVGLDAERLRMRDAHGPDAPGLIWNPAEWRTHLVLDLDGDLSLQCESASQDIWQNDLQEEADVFLAHLARALGTAQLPIRRTEDFVAYAVDLDKGAFADEVASQIHPEHARGLRQRGLL